MTTTPVHIRPRSTLDREFFDPIIWQQLDIFDFLGDASDPVVP